MAKDLRRRTCPAAPPSTASPTSSAPTSAFVGTAASTRSAELGHYYVHPGNRFWRAIHDAGITPWRYQPSEFASLIALGIGFTDLSNLATSTNSLSAPILNP